MEAPRMTVRCPIAQSVRQILKKAVPQRQTRMADSSSNTTSPTVLIGETNLETLR